MRTAVAGSPKKKASAGGSSGGSGGRSAGTAMLGRLALVFLVAVSCSLLLILSLVLRHHSTAVEVSSHLVHHASLQARRTTTTQSPRVAKLTQLLPQLYAMPDEDSDRFCVAWGSLGGCENNASLLASCGKSCKYFIFCQLCEERAMAASKCGNCATPHAKPNECSDGDLAPAARAEHVDTRLELPQSSRVVLEVGGNLGDDLAAFNRSLPLTSKIYSSEAVPDFYDVLEKRYASHRVKVLKFGIADKDANTTFKIDGLGGQASGGLQTAAEGRDEAAAGKSVEVVLRDVHSVLGEIQEETGIPPDAMSINCEGCEYLVLQRMAEQGWLPRIPYLQFSWHTVDAVRNRSARRCELERRLRLSHDLLWYDGFYGWQGWGRRAVNASGADEMQPRILS